MNSNSTLPKSWEGDLIQESLSALNRTRRNHLDQGSGLLDHFDLLFPISWL